MQRWLFFISLGILAVTAEAQFIDIGKTEISFWLDQPGQQDSVLPAAAVLDFHSPRSTDSLYFQSAGIKIKSIRRQEGRRKGNLDFHRSGDSLWVYFSVPEGQTSLYFEYEIPWSRAAYANHVQQTQNYTALNPHNIGGSSSSGRAGMFFPSVPGDASLLHINITFPKDLNSSAPGTLDFITDNQDGSISHYLNSFAEYTPEQFFLIVGDFEHTDPEKLEDEFDFIELDPTTLIAEQVKPKIDPLLAWAGVEDEFSDSTFALIDSLAQSPLPRFYLNYADVDKLTDSAGFQLSKTVLLFLAEGDTAQASNQLLRYYTETAGTGWRERLAADKWEGFQGQSPAKQRITMQLKLEQWRRKNDFLTQMDQQVIDTAFVQPLMDSLQPPFVSISYRYRSSDTAQYILYTQDTAQAPVYHIPLEVTIINRTDTITATGFMDKPKGELKIHSANTPRYVGINVGENFPGTIDNNPPETYHLYLLSSAESAAQRKKALGELFNTTNQNLFSTVLGIAMDDEDPQLRLEALHRAGDLNVPAQQKLKETLRDLSENDPNEKVRARAKELVQKYYNAK